MAKARWHTLPMVSLGDNRISTEASTLPAARVFPLSAFIQSWKPHGQVLADLSAARPALTDSLACHLQEPISTRLSAWSFLSSTLPLRANAFSAFPDFKHELHLAHAVAGNRKLKPLRHRLPTRPTQSYPNSAASVAGTAWQGGPRESAGRDVVLQHF